jgi:hypothetical protein
MQAGNGRVTFEEMMGEYTLVGNVETAKYWTKSRSSKKNCDVD